MRVALAQPLVVIEPIAIMWKPQSIISERIISYNFAYNGTTYNILVHLLLNEASIIIVSIYYEESISRFPKKLTHLYIRSFDHEGDSQFMLYMRTSMSFRHQ